MPVDSPETAPALQLKSADFEAALGYPPNTDVNGRVLCSPVEREILTAYKTNQARLRAQQDAYRPQPRVESMGKTAARAVGYLGATSIAAAGIWMAGWGTANAYIQGETNAQAVFENFATGALDSVIYATDLVTGKEQVHGLYRLGNE